MLPPCKIDSWWLQVERVYQRIKTVTGKLTSEFPYKKKCGGSTGGKCISHRERRKGGKKEGGEVKRRPRKINTSERYVKG